MKSFRVKKVTMKQPIDLNRFFDDDIVFFMHDTPAIQMHEPKGVPKMYVLQISDCDEQNFLRNNNDDGDRKKNNDKESLGNEEENTFGDKRKRSRVRYSPIELAILEENFPLMLQRGPIMYSEVVEKLNAHRTYVKLSTRHVKNWISNKKQKMNRMNNKL